MLGKSDWDKHSKEWHKERLDKEMTPSNEMPLKPCPFCGKQPLFGLTKKTGCQMHGNPIQYVTLSCNCQHKPFVTGGDRYSNGDTGKFFEEGYKCAKELAVKYWNTRATPDKVMVDRAELERVNLLLNRIVPFGDFDRELMREVRQILEAAMKVER